MRDSALFCDRLEALTELRGQAVVGGWIDNVKSGQLENVVRDLLVKHYDPGYSASIQRNFKGYGAARSVALADRSPKSMARAAAQLLDPA